MRRYWIAWRTAPRAACCPPVFIARCRPERMAQARPPPPSRATSCTNGSRGRMPIAVAPAPSPCPPPPTPVEALLNRTGGPRCRSPGPTAFRLAKRRQRVAAHTAFSQPAPAPLVDAAHAVQELKACSKTTLPTRPGHLRGRQQRHRLECPHHRTVVPRGVASRRRRSSARATAPSARVATIPG